MDGIKLIMLLQKLVRLGMEGVVTLFMKIVFKTARFQNGARVSSATLCYLIGSTCAIQIMHILPIAI